MVSFIQGTDLSEMLQGTLADDVMQGNGGDDTLDSGTGNDTFLFGLGDGHDLLRLNDNDDAPTRLNTLCFKPGVLPDDVRVTRSDSTLELLIVSTGDRFSALNFFFRDDPTNGYNDLQLVRFDDGTFWGIAVLTHMALSSTDGNDSLRGLVGDDTLDGGAGNDTLEGSGGNNLLLGNAGDDWLIATEGRNVLDGGDGNDSLRSGPGDDTLDGGSGDDTLDSGTGNDTFLFGLGDGHDLLRLNDNDDAPTRLNTLCFKPGVLPDDVRVTRSDSTLELLIVSTGDRFSALNFFFRDDPTNGYNDLQLVRFDDGTVWDWVTLQGMVTTRTVTGTPASNALTGSSNADRMDGLAGNDTLNAAEGDDWLDGGAGADAMRGGPGDDVYVIDNTKDTVTESAAQGTDTLRAAVTFTLPDNTENLVLTGATPLNGTGNGADNHLFGNAGANILDGRAGADLMLGGAGDDTYVVDQIGDKTIEDPGAGNDQVQSAVNWTLAANLEHLTLTGPKASVGQGNDEANRLTGNALANTLIGLAGNDTLDGREGIDTLIGGIGDDVYIVDNPGDRVVELADQGIDTVLAALSWTLGATLEHLTLSGTAALNATGNEQANRLTGNAGANVLDGGAGADTLVGGAGNDTYRVDASDAVIELPGEGIDTVQSPFSWTLGANLENLSLTGNAALDATGNVLANILTGNAGANRLDGGAGGDSMAGGAGDDVYTVDTDKDIVIEAAGAGNDIVLSWVSWTLGNNLEQLTLLGSTAIGAMGNAQSNILYGNTAANRLSGGAGTDSLYGGAGNDTLDGGTDADALVGGAGDDVYLVDHTGDVLVELTGGGSDTVQSALSWTLGLHIEHLVLTGSALNGTGNELDNRITGNAKANTLVGDTGNDTLDGGAGTDKLIGGMGDDTYVVDVTSDVVSELAGEGTDLIQSSVTCIASTNVENLTLTGTAAINATGNALNNILTGNTGVNTLDGGAGNDTLSAGAGNDKLLGGVGADVLAGDVGSDLFVFAAGDSVLSVTGTGGTGVLTGFDTITGFSLGYITGAQDKIDTVGIPAVVANAASVNGADSTLTIAGQTVKSHAIVKGMITFDATDTYVSALALGSMADVAAVVQYLQANDLGNAGASVAFDTNTGGIIHTFLFTQGDNTGTNNLDLLVDLAGVNANGVTTSTSGVPVECLVIS